MIFILPGSKAAGEVLRLFWIMCVYYNIINVYALWASSLLVVYDAIANKLPRIHVAINTERRQKWILHNHNKEWLKIAKKILDSRIWYKAWGTVLWQKLDFWLALDTLTSLGWAWVNIHNITSYCLCIHLRYYLLHFS